jgi:hypothetical protein
MDTLLLPVLPDALRPKDKAAAHHLATHPLQAGDQLHVVHSLLGFPRGAVLPVYGACLISDGKGQPYQVRAYVRPEANATPVAYQQREAVRFPATHPDQQREQWFGAVLLYLVELDLTDYADCLRLERATPAAAGHAQRLGVADGITHRCAA